MASIGQSITGPRFVEMDEVLFLIGASRFPTDIITVV
jgi:hypothetical protein